MSSASIACGAHAGSPAVMEATARAAAGLGVAIGAHPSYPDREGFGRRPMSIAPEAVAAAVEAQIRMLANACERAGTSVRYVKLHGALYNRSATDDDLARIIADCISGLDSTLVVLALPESAMVRMAREAGLAIAKEGFIDRAYDRSGGLVSRDAEGAVIHDPAVSAARAVRMVKHGRVETIDGPEIDAEVDSLCVHGDSPNAIEMVRTARRSLESAGVAIRSFT